MRPHLHKRLCLSVGPSVGTQYFKINEKSMKNGLLLILNDLDNAGRGRTRDEKEGGMRRKEGRGGKREEEEGGTRRVKKMNKLLKIMKNEKVAKGRIIGLVGPCLLFHTFILTLRKRKCLHLKLWSSAIFFKLTGNDWWQWFLIKNGIMITKYEKIQQELRRNQKTLYTYTKFRRI